MMIMMMMMMTLRGYHHLVEFLIVDIILYSVGISAVFRFLSVCLCPWLLP